MAAITPSQRELGWNVNVCLSSGVAFTGFYQSDDYVSIAEARRELELCFIFEKPDATDDWQLVLLPTRNTASTSILLLTNDMRPFPTPPPNQKVYYVFNFKKQTLYVPLIKRPRRRFEPRYLQIGKSNIDDSFETVPLQGNSNKRTRNASTSLERSQSPTKDSRDDASDSYPPALVEKDEAGSLINSFRQAVLTAAGSRCAISGKGKAWCPNAALFGPAMQAAHVVPQLHWNVYPDANQDIAAAEDSEALRDSWLSTWQYRNGLALAAHLHVCFDARLISIDPRSNRIRAFMPYDLILEYHNKEAIIPPEVDRCALQHHYDMCCIENMATAEPLGFSAAGRKISSRPLVTSTDSSQVIADLNKKTLQTADEVIQCQPSSGKQEAWRFGLDVIKDPVQARKLMEQGFRLQELSSDEEEATRGRPRKRRCRKALDYEERHA